MVDWSISANEMPARIVDAGAGSGRFISSVAKSFPHAELHAVEIDPLASIILRANARVRGFDSRLTVHAKDYCDVSLPRIEAPTLFIGNPPYVRHYHIETSKKQWYAETATKYGLKASRLAGLHLYFYLKTLELSQAQDFGRKQVIPSAVVSGVFNADNLLEAQNRDLYLFWSHRLEDLSDFIRSTS